MKNGHFSSVSLSRHPVQLVILIPFFFSPALNAGVLRFVGGSLAPRCFFVLFPAVFRAVPFFFSPASDAGVLPPLWRGKVFPFMVQSRDHLATITDIYVPSFPYVHSPALNAGFLRRSFRRLMSSGFLGERVDRRTPLFINLTHACGCIVLGKGCPPVRLVYPRPSIFFEFWRKDRHKKTSLKFRDSFGNDGTISVLKRYSQMI